MFEFRKPEAAPHSETEVTLSELSSVAKKLTRMTVPELQALKKQIEKSLSADDISNLRGFGNILTTLEG